MGNEIKICIPSFKRWGALDGKDYFTTAKYVVPESQRDEYTQAVGAARLIVIPDEDDGSIPRKRNWILKNVERPLVMLDDDVRCLTTTEGLYSDDGKFLQTKRMVKLTPEVAMRVLVEGFNLAHQWGCVYWGINVNTDGRNYQQYKPFSLSQMVLGPFHAHLNHDLLYDERLPFKEDYDFSLQVLCRHKKVLRMNKFGYYCEHATNPGGVVSMRTLQRERSNCLAIMRKWGSKIIKYDINHGSMTKLLNGQVNVPIHGV